MPPSYVTLFVKRGKTDAADAEAICTAVTQLVNAIRAHLGELGHVVPKGATT